MLPGKEDESVGLEDLEVEVQEGEEEEPVLAMEMLGELLEEVLIGEKGEEEDPHAPG